MLGIALAATSAPLAVGILGAAAGTGDFNLYSLLSSAGVAGVFAVLFVTGRIRSKAEVDDIRKDRDDARVQLVTLYTTLISQVIPALTNSTSAIERLSRRRGDD